LPGIAGDAYNAFLAPRRSMTDPNFNAEEEGVNMGLNLMGGGTAFGRVPAGSLAMNAYHGSPHRFPPTAKNPLGEFDPMKVGTGEGVQAYGTGAAYLAENPLVAKEYQEALSRGNAYNNAYMIGDKKYTARDLQDFNSEFFPEAVQYVHSGKGDLLIKKMRENEASEGMIKEMQRQIIELEKLGVSTPQGSFYKVDLPDDRITNMLDWDKPLSEQHPDVQKAISTDPRIAKMFSEGNIDNMYQNGGEFYRAVVSKYANDAPNNISLDEAETAAQPAASKYLQNLGIPGIRYLDGGSRADGKGTSNFVVFDPADMTILERNGMTAQDVLAQESKGLVPPKYYGNNDNTYYRRSKSESGSNDVPWQMFAKNKDDIDNAYSGNLFLADNRVGKVVNSDSIIDAINDALSKNYEILDTYQANASDLAQEASPSRIVDSAGLWDSPDITQYIYDEVLAPLGIQAVETPDGLIVFDPDLVKMAEKQKPAKKNIVPPVKKQGK
jgi:hypothetical protein